MCVCKHLLVCVCGACMVVLALHRESLVVLEWAVFAKQGVVLSSDRDTLVWPAV